MMATIKMAPAIRFKGFEEEWAEKKLGEIFDCDIPTNTLSRANLSDNQGEIKNIHYGDILIKYHSCLNISENDIPCIASGNIIEFKHHFLKDGDIIFADAAEDEIVGKSIEICNVGNDYVVAGLHTIATRPLIKFQNYYLGYYLNSNSFHGQLISLMQGTKVLSISKNNLKKTLLKYPEATEQTQIGNYFKELDDLIQFQEQKLTKVTNLKKAMLKKMFPKEGADVPEIRFKGFTKKWEKKKLGEALNFNIPTNTLSRAFLNDKKGVIKNVHYGDILIKYNFCLNVNQQDIPYITKGNIGDFKNCCLKDGDIIFADAAEDETVGKSVEICNVESNYVVSGLHTIAARPLFKFERYYMGYYLNSKSYHNQLISLMQGTKVLSISKTSLKKTILVYPLDETEQQKIGTYFQNLDQLISHSQQKIEQLKHLKQALLQKMFI